MDKFKYYALLSSPKPNHMKMKNQIDFLKINEGVWGAINFNNMIPVQHEGFMKIDVNIEPTDPKHVADYKNLMKDQLTWCNSNKAVIVKKAV